MKVRTVKWLHGVMLFTLGQALMLAEPVLAQSNYPTKTIRIIIGVAPGGATDILARAVGTRLSETFRQPVVIDNRPGANHIIGGDITAKSPKDGYTLQMIPEGFVINPSIYKQLPFDAIKDFSAIAIAALVPNVLVVNPQIPVRTVKEFISYAKEHQGKLSFGSSGMGSPSHMSGELFKVMAKIDATHIPYKGQAQSMVELIGGHLEFSFPTIPAAVAHIRSKKLNALGVTIKFRAKALPDIAPISEAGLPGYEVSGWYGIVGPAGIPANIVNLLNKEINRILQNEETHNQLSQEGAEPRSMSPEEFGTIMSNDLQKWAKVVKDSGIKSQ